MAVDAIEESEVMQIVRQRQAYLDHQDGDLMLQQTGEQGEDDYGCPSFDAPASQSCFQYESNHQFETLPRNIDEVIEERCTILKPRYRVRARSLCMDFHNFDAEYEVFSDEEGVYRAINGYPLGDARTKQQRSIHLKKFRAELETKNGLLRDEVLAPVLSTSAPDAQVRSRLRVLEVAHVGQPFVKSEPSYTEIEAKNNNSK